jgi:hypothetical protein
LNEELCSVSIVAVVVLFLKRKNSRKVRGRRTGQNTPARNLFSVNDEEKSWAAPYLPQATCTLLAKPCLQPYPVSMSMERKFDCLIFDFIP